MVDWILDTETSEVFKINRSCLLVANDESKTKVKYVNHALDVEEVTGHVLAGMSAKELALTWNNRVAFTLTDTLVLKGIQFLDVPEILESQDAFDADAYIATTEINDLLSDLIEELGGEITTTKEEA